MPGLMAIREEFAAHAAAQGRAHHRLAAHDDPDRRADRDARRARRRGPLGARATSSRPRTTPPPRSPSGPSGTPDDPQGVPVFAWKGETLEEYWWCTEQALDLARRRRPEHDPRRRRRRHAARPQGRRVRDGRRRARPASGRLRGVPGRPRARCSARSPRTRSAGRGSPQGIKGVTEETTTGVHRLYQIAETGDAAVPGDQRQRLGHQVEVRQPLRLPPLAGRRHQPRDRRA